MAEHGRGVYSTNIYYLAHRFRRDLYDLSVVCQQAVELVLNVAQLRIHRRQSPCSFAGPISV